MRRWDECTGSGAEVRAFYRIRAFGAYGRGASAPDLEDGIGGFGVRKRSLVAPAQFPLCLSHSNVTSYGWGLY